jgi:hypothetical protein
MISAKSSFKDPERTPMERFGLRRLALGLVKIGQIVQAHGHSGMLRTEGSLLDRKRSFDELLGLCMVTLVLEDNGQVVDARGHIRMLVPKNVRPDPELPISQRRSLHQALTILRTAGARVQGNGGILGQDASSTRSVRHLLSNRRLPTGVQRSIMAVAGRICP